MVAGLTGAASGRFYSHRVGLGGTVQIPGILANRFRDLVAAGVRDPATRLLKDAIADEKLFRELLSAKTTDGSLPDKSIKRLNAWASVVAAEHGGALIPDATEAPPERIELPAGNEQPIDRTETADEVATSAAVTAGSPSPKFAGQLPSLIKKEGGFQLTNRKADRGGRTFAGISERANPDWPGWEVLNAGGDPTPHVGEWYYQRYWLPIQGDDLDDRIVEGMFSASVLSGPQTAVRLAQEVAGVAPDGLMGPVTLQAINSIPPQHFAEAYKRRRIERYRRIVANDPSQRRFLRGWERRARADATPKASAGLGNFNASVEEFNVR